MRMLAPHIRTTIVDKEPSVTFHLMAHRQLSRGELVGQVRQLHADPKIKC